VVPETVRLPQGGASSSGAPPGAGSKSGSGSEEPPEVAAARTKARKCAACSQIFSGQARFCPFDGERLIDAPDWDPKEDPLLGKTIDNRYKVLTVLGEGETGKVYKVQHVALGRRFALKVLRRDFARNTEMVARFMQEAQAAAAIGHPNIIAVSDFGELPVGKPGEEPLPYFVMEFLAGMSLPLLLQSEGPLTPARAGPIFLQSASALGAAHAAGVIHRNLKPANIFLTRTGERDFIKLLDFGVAKIVGTSRFTKPGMVPGAPHYMSPEQAAGEPIDQRVDIYSLGVIMYECFSGRVPFEAETYAEVLRKHINEAPAPIEGVVPDSKALGAFGPIVMKCLAKSSKDRFASMVEVAAAIEGAMAPILASANRARAAAARGDGGLSTRRLAFIAGGVVIAGVVSVAAWRMLRGEPAATPGEPPPTGVVAPTAAPQAPTTASQAPSGPSVEPPEPPPSAVVPAAPAAPAAPTTLGTQGTTGPSGVPSNVPEGATAAPPFGAPLFGAPTTPPPSATTPVVSPWAPAAPPSGKPTAAPSRKPPGEAGGIVDPWGAPK
jgi:hypothetical protein